jgi:hypothetical protein
MKYGNKSFARFRAAKERKWSCRAAAAFALFAPNHIEIKSRFFTAF